MINILVCDDSKEYAEWLTKFLKYKIEHSDYSDFMFNIVIICDSAAALDFCIHNDIDIFFLDIDMPKINGFDIATFLKEQKARTKLIFVSNFDHLVYTSLRFNPFRFLRKSKSLEELPDAFEDALKEILIDNGFLILGNRHFNERIFYSQILYFESKGNYVEIVTVDNRKFMYRTTISSLATELLQYDFIRIHASYLVSMSKIKLIKADSVEMLNGTILKISRKFNNSTKRSFSEYLRK